MSTKKRDNKDKNKVNKENTSNKKVNQDDVEISDAIENKEVNVKEEQEGKDGKQNDQNVKENLDEVNKVNENKVDQEENVVEPKKEEIVEPPKKEEIVEPPKNEEKIIEAPKNEEKIIEAPKNKEEIVEAPKNEEEIVEASKKEEIVESPKKEEKIIEAPKKEEIVEAPKKEEIVESPKNEEKIIEAPKKEEIVEPPKKEDKIIEAPKKEEKIIEAPKKEEIVESQENKKESPKEEIKLKSPKKEEKVQQNTSTDIQQPKPIDKSLSPVASSSSSFSDIFSYSRHNNAKRIQSQIAQMQINALEYTKSLIKLSKNFERMKAKFNNRTNRFFNTLFSFFGFSCKSNKHRHNLFIFSAQAWLLDLSTILEKSMKSDYKKDLKFSDIFDIIKQNEISSASHSQRELAYLNNLGIFSGNLLQQMPHSHSFTLFENNIGKNFFASLSHIIVNDFILPEEEIEKKGFEEILFELFKKAVERTLNLEKKTDKIEYNQIFNKMKRDRENFENEEFTYEEYFKEVLDGRKLNENEVNEIKICTETFYDFSQHSIEDILTEYKIFIRNCSSLIFKIKRFVSLSCDKYKDKAEDMMNFLIKIVNASPAKEKLIETSNLVCKSLLKKMARAAKKGHDKAGQLKLWVNDSFEYVKQFQIPNRIYSQLQKGIDFILIESQYVIKFTINKFELGKEKFIEIKNKIVNSLINFYKNTSEIFRDKIKSLQNLIIIREDKEKGLFTILINKEIILTDPRILISLFESIFDIIRSSYDKVNKNTEGLLQSAKENYTSTKQFIMARYRRFVQCEALENEKQIEMSEYKRKLL